MGEVTEVKVYELFEGQVDGYHAITFGRYRTSPHKTLPCDRRNVIGHNPLKVILGLPPGMVIDGMREFMGKDVMLTLEIPKQTALSNGE